MKYIYLHVPKAAGTTLKDIAEAQYGVEGIATVYGEDLLDIPTAVRRANDPKVRFLRGHIAYGWHREVRDKCLYLTILREPVSRVRSLYDYARRSRGHHLFPVASQMALADFVSSGVSCEANNGQVRQLSGMDGDFPQVPYGTMEHSYGACGEEMLHAAIANLLKDFVVVGTTDNFPTFLHHLRQHLGWSKIPFTDKNVTRTATVPTPYDVELIRRYNALDLMLVEFVQNAVKEGLWRP